MAPTFFVDYHNVHLELARTHPLPARRGAFDQDTVAWVVDRLCERIQRWRSRSVPSWTSCDIRFYSGWFDGDTATDHHGMVAGAVRRLPSVLPGRVRFGYHVATSLIDLPATRITHTLRPRRMPRLRWSFPVHGCQLPGACPIRAAADCLEGMPCSANGCNGSAEHAVRGVEQKTVDSHIVCDFLTIAREEPAVLLSNDTDFVPAVLLAASQNPGRVYWMRLPGPNGLDPDAYHENDLRRYSVELVDLAEE